MNVARGAAAFALSMTLASCAEKNELAAPDGGTRFPSPKTATTLMARSPTNQTGVADSFVASPPVVLVLDQNHLPMSNAEVSFVVASGDGLVSPDRVRTDEYGLARTSWRLGNTTEENRLTATVPGIQQLTFRANSLLPQGAPALESTRWDLVLSGGKPLPQTYSGGGSTWTITGGHYVFLTDSTYAFGYDVDGVENLRPLGKYFRLASGAVQFYLAGPYPPSTFYGERGGLFSTATIKGNLITVTYEDFVDFEIETYVMSPR